MEKKYLLPPNGITGNWSDVSQNLKYQDFGLSDETFLYAIDISKDFKIEVTDVKKVDKKTSRDIFGKTYLYTALTFWKKELNSVGDHVPQECWNEYTIYYPYGTRFNQETLAEAGVCLNALINKARDLPTFSEQINTIKNAQQQIVNLFNLGTQDPCAIDKIMSKSGVNPIYGFLDEHVRVACEAKDWLPLIKQRSTEAYSEME